jgi:hypothetical protein
LARIVKYKYYIDQFTENNGGGLKQPMNGNGVSNYIYIFIKKMINNIYIILKMNDENELQQLTRPRLYRIINVPCEICKYDQLGTVGIINNESRVCHNCCMDLEKEFITIFQNGIINITMNNEKHIELLWKNAPKERIYSWEDDLICGSCGLEDGYCLAFTPDNIRALCNICYNKAYENNFGFIDLSKRNIILHNIECYNKLFNK